MRSKGYAPLNPEVGAQLLLAKQRNGPLGLVSLTFHTTLARFTERATPRHTRQLEASLA